jgi:hypothetical protein
MVCLVNKQKKRIIKLKSKFLNAIKPYLLRSNKERHVFNQKKRIIKFKSNILNDIKSYLLQDNKERHAFLYCNLAINDDSIVFLVDKLITLKDEDIEHSSTHVQIDKDLVNEIFIDYTNSTYEAIISCHSHPFENDNVWFSFIDDKNDKDLFHYFYDELVKYKSQGEMATMVFGQNTIASRFYDTKKKDFLAIEKIISMEYPVKYTIPTNYEEKDIFNNELFNRQILAFGEDGQKLLSNLKVTLIGAGGTGSILAESLIRLGVKKLTIIDDDKLELSNLNRWQGGKVEDVGKYKTDILKNNLKYIVNNDIEITTFNKSLFDDEIINHIKDSDVIIGAVDCNKARYFLNRYSISYLIPYLDCSTGIKAKDGKIQFIKSRNVIVIPSVTQCMDCEELCYDIQNFSYDFLPKHIKEEAKKRKYIQTDDDIKAPSVYPINMLSVSGLLLEFMNLFMGYKDTLHQYTVIDYMNLEQIGNEKKSDEDEHNIKLCWNKESPSKQCITCNDYIALGEKAEIETIAFK